MVLPDTYTSNVRSETGEMPGMTTPRAEAAEAELLRLLLEQQNRGALARQELVSMLPVTILGPVSRHERVLDMCASPGSKSSQLLGQSPDFAGLFVANEYDRRRLGRLHHRLQKECSSHCAVVTNFDARFFPLLRGLQFDKIICDVPCSGDGILRRAPQGWASYDAAAGVELHGVQASILERALDLLVVGGRLVYSTCSQNPLENEAVIARVLTARRARGDGHDDIEVQVLEPVKGLAVDPGLTTWLVPAEEPRPQEPQPDVPAQGWTYQSDQDDVSDWGGDAGGRDLSVEEEGRRRAGDRRGSSGARHRQMGASKAASAAEQATGEWGLCASDIEDMCVQGERGEAGGPRRGFRAVTMQQVGQDAAAPSFYARYEDVPVESRGRLHRGLFPPGVCDERLAGDLAKVGRPSGCCACAWLAACCEEMMIADRRCGGGSRRPLGIGTRGMPIQASSAAILLCHRSGTGFLVLESDVLSVSVYERHA